MASGYLSVRYSDRVALKCKLTMANHIAQPYGTFIETSLQEVNEETPLMPFRTSDYEYWNSKDTHSLLLQPEVPNNKCAPINTFIGCSPILIDTNVSDYTYLPIGEVDLNPKVPPDEQKRREQRDYLRKYFNPSELEGARQYIVIVSLPTGYFNGSYILKILIKVGEKQLEIGMVSVLGRGKSTSCGNCQGRRAVGARVRGVTAIPHEVVRGLTDTMLPMSTEAQSTTEDSRTAEIIRKSLNSHVALPSGKVVSWPSNKPHPLTGTLPGPTDASQATMPDEEAPLVRLLSRPNPYRDGLSGSEFADWEDHGEPGFKSWIDLAL
jgi:hypothetical protein